MSDTENFDPGQVMQATEGFACDIGDRHYVVIKGDTHVARAHELVQRFPDRFKPVQDDLSYAVEAATATPGERRRRAVSTR